ncbi:MAG: hypothetical protein WCK51_15230 [Armatimonadota bacterium]
MGELRGLLLRVFAGIGLCTATGTAVDRTLLQESFVPIPVDLSVDRRLDAYVPFYRRMLPLVDDRHPISPLELRKVADDWVRASQGGQLLPLEASFHGENLVESPKAQLLYATAKIADQLNRVAEVEIQNGLFDDGISDALRANVMIESIRFASPSAMLTTANVARRSLKLASTNISRAKRIPAHLLVQVRSEGDLESRYADMMRRVERQKLVYSVRYGAADAEEVSREEYETVALRNETRAQKFFGFESAVVLNRGAKACQFAPESKVK